VSDDNDRWHRALKSVRSSCCGAPVTGVIKKGQWWVVVECSDCGAQPPMSDCIEPGDPLARPYE
jgi:hypothetical protein